MFITAEEMNRRLGSNKNLSPSVPVPTDNPLPKNSATKDNPKEDVPESLKTLAASLVAQGVSESIVCKEFSVKPKDIQSMIGTTTVSKNTERIRELALNKLLIALGLMTADKYENASLKDLSTNVTALSRVIEKTSDVTALGSRVQFFVYAPDQRSIQDYKVIDVMAANDS